MGVCRTPVITGNPPNVTLVPGQQTWLAVTATGDNLTYQWFEGALNDETHLYGTGPAVAVSPGQTTRYWVKVTSVTSPCAGQATAVVKAGPAWVSYCPAITTQPASTSVMPGTTTTLSVAAEGTSLAYEWREVTTGSNLGTEPKGTSPTFTTDPITAATAPKNYWVRVLSGACYRDSDTVTISLCSSPTVSWGAAQTQVASGQSQTISVNYDPLTNVELTFYRGVAGDVAGSTVIAGPGPLSSITIAPTATTSYWARVRSTTGVCYANTTTLTVNVCIPTITTQPAGGNVNPNGTIDLNVVANGGALTYQWYEGGAGDTTHPLAAPAGQQSIYHLTVTHTAQYWVRVTGSCTQKADSNVVTVTLCQPIITVQPQPKQTTQGTAVTLSVTATGPSPNYQWYQGAAGVTTTPVGTNSASISVSPQYTTDYWVKVTTCTTPVNSTAARVSVAPVITTQPVNARITRNTTATFTIVADAAPVSYQWYRGLTGDASQPISGATAATYTTAALTADATYWVRVTSGTATTDSVTVTATVCVASTVNVNNATQTSGAAVFLTVASPNAGETYSWYAGNPGDTSQPIALNSTQYTIQVNPTQTTTYWVRIITSSCSADSLATPVVICFPKITAAPASVGITVGQSTTLSVTATGTPALTYQWYVGASGTTTSPVSGATSASLSVSPSATTSYWVRVTSGAGAGCYVNSAAVAVTVCNPRAITNPPASYIVASSSSSYTLGVTATGTSLSYQWYSGAAGDVSHPVGTNSSTFTVSPGVSTYYWVRVSGACGTANSAAALVSVPPDITTQPASITICNLRTATLSVTATGSMLTYQWYQGPDITQPIAGATGTSYTTPALAATTSYWVLVKSGNAQRGSATATVTVTPGPTIWGPSSSWVTGTCYNIWIDVDGNLGDFQYAWYQGAAGNTSPLIGTSYYKMVCPSVRTSYWVRVTDPTTGCYSDSPVILVP